jgi:hypothetical protein
MVQEHGDSTTTTVSSFSVAFPVPVTPGNLVVVRFTGFVQTHTPGAIITVTDSTGINLYAQRILVFPTTSNVLAIAGMFDCKVTTGGAFTVTVSVSTSVSVWSLVLNELSFTQLLSYEPGPTLLLPVTTSSPSLPPLGVSGTDACLAILALNATSTYAAGPGYTLGYNIAWSGGHNLGTVAINALNIVSQSTPSWTLGSSVQCWAVGAAYKCSQLQCSVTSLGINDAPTVTLTGAGTNWLTSHPVFTLSGGTGASITNVVYQSDTQAQAILNSGTQPGVSLMIGDPTTGATATVTVPNTINTYAYVMKSGSLVIFLFGDSSNNPVAVLKVNNQPTILINGSPVTNPSFGPYGTQQTTYASFVIYQLPTALSPTDVVNFSAPAGWVTTYPGSSPSGTSLGYLNGVVPNYTGQLEPPVFNYLPFTYLPQSPNDMTLGFNGTSVLSTWPHSVPMNWLLRGQWFGLGGTITFDSNIRPATVPAVSYAIVTNNAGRIGGNFIDNQAYPDLAGVYTLVVDDTSQNHPMLVYGSFGPGSTGYTIISGPTSASGPNISVGTWDGTAWRRRIWQWVITRKPDATVMNLIFAINVQTWNNVPGNWTLTNEWLFPPLGDGGGPADPTFNRSNLAAIDPNFTKVVTTPDGKGPSHIRYVDPIGGWEASIVDAVDFRQLTDFSCAMSQPGPATPISITAVRPYLLSNSPNVYFSGPFTNSIANPSPPSPNLAYYYTPADTIWGNWFAMFSFAGQNLGYGAMIAEFVTAVPHNLKTGWFPNLTGTMPTITLTNYGGTGTPTYTIQTKDLVHTVYYITGPNTFVLFFYPTSGTNLDTQPSAPTVMNTLAVQYNVPGGSPFYASCVVPGNGALSIEMAGNSCAQSPSCGIYVNVSPSLTDDAVTAQAQRLIAYLPPGRKAIIEYCNEIWNTSLTYVPPMFYAMATLSGIGSASWATGTPDATWGIWRANQVHKLYEAVFTTAGRAGDLTRTFGSSAGGADLTARNIHAINNYNVANPSTPMRLDTVNIAPYLDMASDTWPDPSGACTVATSGSGNTLVAGNYYAAITYIDRLTGMESAVGNSTSLQFTVASGQLATITRTDTAPAYASKWNLYLSAVNGTSTALHQYATNILIGTTSQNCTTPVNTGNPSPPTNNRLPSIVWAAASITSNDSRSIANPAVNPGNRYYQNPWTLAMYCDFMRHYVKYNVAYNGPSQGGYGAFQAQNNSLATYNLVSGQTDRPYLITYENDIESVVPYSIENNPSQYTNSIGVLTHDVIHHPDQYYVELAYHQSQSMNGIKRGTPLTDIGNPYFDGRQLRTWYNMNWLGQKIGRGYSNQFAINTGKDMTLTNEAVRQQAWLDWVSGSPPVNVPGELIRRAFYSWISPQPSPPIPPSVRVNDFVAVFTSMLNLVNSTQIFGPNSVAFVLSRDSDIKYPADAAPFALLVPERITSQPVEIGGGRFTKTWRMDIVLIIIVRNIYDIAYQDNIAFTTTDNDTGMYVLAHKVINLIEQAVPLAPDLSPTLIELPIAKTVESPYRYQDANEYIALPIVFEIYFQETLPANLPVNP